MFLYLDHLFSCPFCLDLNLIVIIHLSFRLEQINMNPGLNSSLANVVFKKRNFEPKGVILEEDNMHEKIMEKP